MTVEDWKTYRYAMAEIKKDMKDEVHEFLTKVFNVYMVKLPPNVFKHLDMVRDKLITLTTRFTKDNFDEFCESFSKVYRLIIVDKEIPEDVKGFVRELAEKTKEFFTSKGMHSCVREIKYNLLRVKVLYNSSPLKDAMVAVETEGKVVASVKTDENGTCALEVPEGKYSLYVYKFVKDGEYIYEEKTITVPIDSEVLFDIKETKSAADIARERGGRPLIKEVS
uniref:Carboxypeptidase regulatory-like domain-containing protein n=1 Tax=Ignisphaera aggregans TaxID=334771 RepID=A0A7C2VP86_9CREN